VTSRCGVDTANNCVRPHADELQPRKPLNAQNKLHRTTIYKDDGDGTWLLFLPTSSNCKFLHSTVSSFLFSRSFRYLIHLLSLAESLWLRYAQLLLRLSLWLQRKYLLRLSLMILCNWHDEKSRALTGWRSGKEAARRSYSEKPGMAASTLMSNACKY
jgi:hypothetical protein